MSRDDELDGYEGRADVHLRQHGLTNPPFHLERCSCGGEISVTRAAVDELRGAIATHQATPRHQAWRRMRERR